MTHGQRPGAGYEIVEDDAGRSGHGVGLMYPREGPFGDVHDAKQDESDHGGPPEQTDRGDEDPGCLVDDDPTGVSLR